MQSEMGTKSKPEDMLLRVIRVAEILIMDQGDVLTKTLVKPVQEKQQIDTHSKQTQKTQS